MSSDIYREDMKITSVIKDYGEGNSNPFGEFKFWSNNFDSLWLFYDHLNVNEDFNKVKPMGRQSIFQNLISYLMRCVVLSRGVFESIDDYEKTNFKFKEEIT